MHAVASVASHHLKSGEHARVLEILDILESDNFSVLSMRLSAQTGVKDFSGALETIKKMSGTENLEALAFKVGVEGGMQVVIKEFFDCETVSKVVKDLAREIVMKESNGQRFGEREVLKELLGQS